MRQMEVWLNEIGRLGEMWFMRFLSTRTWLWSSGIGGAMGWTELGWMQLDIILILGCDQVTDISLLACSAEFECQVDLFKLRIVDVKLWQWLDIRNSGVILEKLG